MDGSPNAQARALLQLHDTPITADLLSPAEILHGCPAQGTVLSRPSKRVNIHQIRQRLVKLQERQKEHFDRAHRAKDLHPLKVKEQVQFLHKRQELSFTFFFSSLQLSMLCHKPLRHRHLNF